MTSPASALFPLFCLLLSEARSEAILLVLVVGVRHKGKGFLAGRIQPCGRTIGVGRVCKCYPNMAGIKQSGYRSV